MTIAFYKVDKMIKERILKQCLLINKQKNLQNCLEYPKKQVTL